MTRLARALALLATVGFLVLIIPFLILITLYVLSRLVAPIPALVVLLVYCVLVVGLIGFWLPRSRLAGGPGVDHAAWPVARRLGQGVALAATLIFLTLTLPFIALSADFYIRDRSPLGGGPLLPVLLMYGIVIVALVVFWIAQLTRRHRPQ
jgi:hypothetical protein